VESWLRPRLDRVPDSLRERIWRAVNAEGGRGKGEGYEGGSVLLPERLRRAGELLLAQAQSGPPSRETAITLLAADALMTLACQAMAEEAPERLGEMR
jgi:hypothetical protein